MIVRMKSFFPVGDESLSCQVYWFCLMEWLLICVQMTEWWRVPAAAGG